MKKKSSRQVTSPEDGSVCRDRNVGIEICTYCIYINTQIYPEVYGVSIRYDNLDWKPLQSICLRIVEKNLFLLSNTLLQLTTTGEFIELVHLLTTETYTERCKNKLICVSVSTNTHDLDKYGSISHRISWEN